MPGLREFYPGICLTTEEKGRKNLSQGSLKSNANFAYFKLKRINAALSYEKLYVSAEKYGVSEFDIGELQKVLNLEINIK